MHFKERILSKKIFIYILCVIIAFPKLWNQSPCWWQVMTHLTSIPGLLSFVISAFLLKQMGSNKIELPDTSPWYSVKFVIEVNTYLEESSPS